MRVGDETSHHEHQKEELHQDQLIINELVRKKTKTKKEDKET